MRVLVTGVAGFIGSHVAEGLLAEGHEVTGLDDLSAGTLENLATVPSVRFIEGDLRDVETVKRATRGATVVLHHAAVRSVPRSFVEPGLSTDVNVKGTLNVLLAAADHGARVVFASSSSVYGDQRNVPMHESATAKPKSPYALTKHVGEQYCAMWTRLFRLPTISLRYFNVYGPRQDPAGEYAVVVPKFISACLTRERPVIHGDGEQARDFTYIDDVVRANILALAAPDPAWGQVINIAGGYTPTSVSRLLEIIARLTGTSPDPRYLATRPGDVRLTSADISAARQLIGYGDTTPIEEGLQATVSWFMDNRARWTRG